MQRHADRGHRPKTRVCRECGRRKPLDSSHFVRTSYCVFGLQWMCKSCMNVYHRQWKASHPEIAVRRRELYRLHYGPISRANEERRRREHPIRVRAQRVRHSMRDRARTLRIPFDDAYFTVNRLIRLFQSTPNCPCCGVSIDYGFKVAGRVNNRCPSMDRLVPLHGYTRRNTVLVCWRCNNLKRDASPDELERVAMWFKEQLSRKRLRWRTDPAKLSWRAVRRAKQDSR